MRSVRVVAVALCVTCLSTRAAAGREDALSSVRRQVGQMRAERLSRGNDVAAWDQQLRNLDAAAGLSGLRVRSSLRRGVAALDVATRWQAASVGTRVPSPAAMFPFRPPSAAFAALAAAMVTVPSPPQVAALDEVDGSPEPFRSALSAWVDAFLALRAAWTAHAAGSSPIGGVLVARLAFAEASATLGEAAEVTTTLPPVEIVVAPAFALDLDGTDSVYEEHVALSLDVGGADVYRNNAGGSDVLAIGCVFPSAHGAAAALLDLGGDDDRYVSGKSCGVNGGGGGIYQPGTGTLIDDGGSDVYVSGGLGANGGAGVGGLGLLLDAAGPDSYETEGNGGNGGGESTGIGLLLDLGDGGDTYTALRDYSSNGGASVGHGFLYDDGGDDAYTAGGQGMNGGGFAGAGFLFDAAGDDTYTGLADGVNGGAATSSNLPSSGFLYDAAGSDSYRALYQGVNGGGIGRGSSGLLIDRSGDDDYWALFDGVNGGGLDGTGLLLDARGTDRYFDVDGGEGTDVTVVPKGTGAQVDTEVEA